MSGKYEDLKVWQKAFELTLLVYKETQCFPRHEMYGLTNQMRRAAVSIPSNIAEGKGKTSDRDFAVFLCHARASLHELETQSLIAEQLGYWQGTAAATVKSLTAERKDAEWTSQCDEARSRRAHARKSCRIMISCSRLATGD
jgi:four helix bundle protein